MSQVRLETNQVQKAAHLGGSAGLPVPHRGLDSLAYLRSQGIPLPRLRSPLEIRNPWHRLGPRGTVRSVYSVPLGCLASSFPTVSQPVGFPRQRQGIYYQGGSRVRASPRRVTPPPWPMGNYIILHTLRAVKYIVYQVGPAAYGQTSSNDSQIIGQCDA